MQLQCSCSKKSLYGRGYKLCIYYLHSYYYRGTNQEFMLYFSENPTCGRDPIIWALAAPCPPYHHQPLLVFIGKPWRLHGWQCQTSPGAERAVRIWGVNWEGQCGASPTQQLCHIPDEVCQNLKPHKCDICIRLPGNRIGDVSYKLFLVASNLWFKHATWNNNSCKPTGDSGDFYIINLPVHSMTM